MRQKPNVVLDLDNTLISAEALTEFPFDKPRMKDKAIQFQIHDMDGYYIVFERPGLQKFLDYLFAHFNVSVWTAASKDYALFIVKHVLLTKPSRRLQYLFVSYHCKLSRKFYRNDSKNLRMLSEKFNLPEFNEHNTVIIDDLPEVCESQPDNCIAIHPFEILDEGSEHDNVLEKDVKPRLEEFRHSGHI